MGKTNKALNKSLKLCAVFLVMACPLRVFRATLKPNAVIGNCNETALLR